jgi:hypothetical protein
LQVSQLHVFYFDFLQKIVVVSGMPFFLPVSAIDDLRGAICRF